MKILLIRHGSSVANLKGLINGRKDIPLCEYGKKQITLLANMFDKDIKYKTIYTSPLIRTKQSSEIIANKLDIKQIIEDELLLERDYGIAEGMSFEEKNKRFCHIEIPGAETHKKVEKRSKAFLNKIVNSTNDENVIVVSSGSFINSLIKVISNGKFGTHKTCVDNASATRLDYSNGIFTIDYLNQLSSEKLVSIKEIERHLLLYYSKKIGISNLAVVKTNIDKSIDLIFVDGTVSRVCEAVQPDKHNIEFARILKEAYSFGKNIPLPDKCHSVYSGEGKKRTAIRFNF